MSSQGRQNYTIVHANGQPLEDVVNERESKRKYLVKVTKSLTKEQFGGICLCLFLTDLEIDSYMYFENSKVDVGQVAKSYFLGPDETSKYKYKLSCNGTNNEEIIVGCRSLNFIKGFIYAANIISPPSSRWINYTITMC